MRYKVFFSFFLCVLLIGINGYATPLMVKDGTHVLNIGGTDYTISDKVDSFTSFDAVIGGYLGDNWTGYYLGTILGNDEQNQYAALKDLIPYFMDNPMMIMADTAELPNTTGGSLSISSLDGWLTGTWTLSGNAQADALFYTVKGSSEFALYYLDPAADHGDWTTEHLTAGKENNPMLSHLSVVYGETNPVPEPATLLLLGSGLLGLARFSRKK